ncbi:MAG TPA: SDR family NAD(P)-dependent oxidoreductase [Gaiellaceae bacterium]|nr:SDR family NAD(P)-dependent oxidoreductase [Gaiellaceae bacterium]
MELSGTVCLVTGATSGIGRATAVALGEAGADVLVSGRDEAALAAVAAEANGRALPCDLAEPGAGGRLAADALAACGRVDVLVNCAGVGQFGPAAALTPDDVERVLRINVSAPIDLTSALLPGMLARQQGHVVNLGSILGRVGHRREAVYAASKAAIAIFSDSLRDELRGTGVSVSLISPGAVDTPFFARRGAPYDRRWPAPVEPARIAAAIVRAVGGNRAETFVPAWLSIAVRVRRLAPGLYRVLAGRFG